MFSSGIKRSSNRNKRNLLIGKTPPPPAPPSQPESPVSPVPSSNSIPNRPTTGTPAPWAPRLSVLAGIPPTNKSDKESEVDPINPIYVGQFPEIVRKEQADFLRSHIPETNSLSGVTCHPHHQKIALLLNFLQIF